jgi:hypothetical protein
MEVDLTDGRAVFEKLFEDASKSGYQSHLLGIMHKLMAIPPRREAASFMWGNILALTQKATSQFEYESQTQADSFAELVRLLEEKEQEGADSHKSRLAELEEKNALHLREIEELKEQVKNGGGGGGGGPPMAPPPPAPMIPSAPPMAPPMAPPLAPGIPSAPGKQLCFLSARCFALRIQV